MDENLRAVVEKSQNIVFFGGAGVSTESGIPDFRSSGGLYSQKYKYPPEEMLSHDFLITHPEEFFDFQRDKMLHPDVRPNKAHYALAKLERMGKLKAVITQNVDGLHQAAGSRMVLELHGSILRHYCMRCHKKYGVEALSESAGVPKCDCGGTIRPDVVLYGEGLDSDVMTSAAEYVAKSDVLIVGGTSLAVYPAAGLIHYFTGSRLVLINKAPTLMDKRADLIFRESIGEVMDLG